MSPCLSCSASHSGTLEVYFPRVQSEMGVQQKEVGICAYQQQTEKRLRLRVVLATAAEVSA